MCRVTKDGYVLKDGTKISYDSDITSLEIKDINSLNNEPGTKWDTFVLHVGLKDLNNKLDANFTKILNKIEESNKIHYDSCPFNKEGIIKLVDSRVFELADDGLGERIANRVEAVLKKKGVKVYRGFKGILRDFILIAAAVSAAIMILKFFGD